MSLILDAGAFVAVERSDRQTIALIKCELQQRRTPITHGGIVGRNLPRALGLGVAAIIAIYLLANLAYLKVLNIAEIVGTPLVAATVAERTMGSIGGSFVSLTILISDHRRM